MIFPIDHSSSICSEFGHKLSDSTFQWKKEQIVQVISTHWSIWWYSTVAIDHLDSLKSIRWYFSDSNLLFSLGFHYSVPIVHESHLNRASYFY